MEVVALVAVIALVTVVIGALVAIQAQARSNVRVLLEAHQLWGRIYRPDDPAVDPEGLTEAIRTALEHHLPALAGPELAGGEEPPWYDQTDADGLPLQVEREDVAFIRPGEPLVPGLVRDDPPFQVS